MAVGDRFWTGSRNKPNEQFRVELESAGLLFIWYDPNPHGGLDVGENVGFEEVLLSEARQETIRETCGAQALLEVIAAVRDRLSNVQATAAIDEVMRAFFAAFTNRGRAPDVDALYGLFVDSAVVSTRTAGRTAIQTVSGFVEPRRALLTGGRLIDFEEREVTGRTEVFGGLAQRFSLYEKSGTLDGNAFTGRGTKAFQLVVVDGAWKIVALCWEDSA